ncbi:zinc-binding dehydrogenase [Gordonia terrae]
MKAWQFTQYNAPLEFVEVATPRPEPGEVLIDIKACGICHSDLAIMAGQLKPHPEKQPVILGHEIAGVITEIGSGVTDYAVGDRVGVYQMFAWHGNQRDGGYAEFVTAPTGALVPIPDSTSYAQAAMGTDAGMTAHNAIVSTGGITLGDRVGVIGLGGLGTIGARIARIRGATVYAADPSANARGRGLDAGVSEVFTDVNDFRGMDLDVIVDFAGYGTTTAGAIESIRTGGRVVQVGLGVPEATINTFALAERQATLVGVFGGTAKDIAAVYDLFDSGRLTSPITEIGLDELTRGFELLENGEAEGRIVVRQD